MSAQRDWVEHLLLMLLEQVVDATTLNSVSCSTLLDPNLSLQWPSSLSCHRHHRSELGVVVNYDQQIIFEVFLLENEVESESLLPSSFSPGLSLKLSSKVS